MRRPVISPARRRRRRPAERGAAPMRPALLLAALAAAGLAAVTPGPARALPRLECRTAPAVVHIGDTVTVSVRVKPGAGVETPRYPEKVGAFEVLGVARSDSADVTRLAIHLASFETGRLWVPPLAIAVRAGTGVDSLRTSPYLVTVESLLPADSAAVAAAKLRAAHPPMSIPQKFRWGVAFGYLLVLAALAAAGWWWWRQRSRRPGEALFPASRAPARPPEAVALEALDAVAARNYVERGLFKPHYTEILDILRVYIEGRYGIEALECTTSELMVALDGRPLDGMLRTRLNRMLDEADLVKFAKVVPQAEPARQLLDEARSWVRETTPVVAPAPPTAAPPAAPANPAADSADPRPPGGA